MPLLRRREYISPPQIWTGDFNALTREDYSEQEWERVGEVRARECWEKPQVRELPPIKMQL